jgi:hypothetical protein
MQINAYFVSKKAVEREEQAYRRDFQETILPAGWDKDKVLIISA